MTEVKIDGAGILRFNKQYYTGLLEKLPISNIDTEKGEATIRNTSPLGQVTDYLFRLYLYPAERPNRPLVFRSTTNFTKPMEQRLCEVLQMCDWRPRTSQQSAAGLGRRL